MGATPPFTIKGGMERSATPPITIRGGMERSATSPITIRGGMERSATPPITIRGGMIDRSRTRHTLAPLYKSCRRKPAHIMAPLCKGS